MQQLISLPVLILFLLFQCSFSNVFAQWSLDMETGAVFNGYNNVQIPGDEGTRFSLTNDLNTSSKVFYRLRLSYLLQEKHYFSVLYAPLKVRSEGRFDMPVNFQQTVFQSDALVNGIYQFNSYRLTYRYLFPRTRQFQFGIGATAKVRDARITLSDSLNMAEKDNLGFVPLINFYAEWFVKERLSLVLKGDALAAPQGRAEDVLLAAKLYPSKNMTLKLGYRMLEGGAGNDEVYNFTMFHYAVIGAVITL